MSKTIEQQLATAREDNKQLSEENTTLKASAETHAEEVATAKAEVPESAAKEITDLKASNSKLTEDNKALKEDNESTAKLHEDIGIKADADTQTNKAAIDKHVETKGAAKAAEVTSMQGLPDSLPTSAQSTPGATDTGTPKSAAEHWETQFTE